MNAKHPFLDKAYLWFHPRDFFFMGKLPDSKLSLRWEQLPRIRKIAPTSRIIDPDSRTPPKRVPANPVYLPSMRTIVRTLCPTMVQFKPEPYSTPTIPVVDRGDGYRGDAAVATTSGVQLGDLQRQFAMEEIVIGDDVEIDWDWWGSRGSNSAQDIHPVMTNPSQLMVKRKTKPPRLETRGLNS